MAMPPCFDLLNIPLLQSARSKDYEPDLRPFALGALLHADFTRGAVRDDLVAHRLTS